MRAMSEGLATGMNSAATLTLPDGRRSAALLPGTIVGDDLRIVAKIGSGGMGTVYLATDTGPLERSCAIKILDRASAGTAGHGRFLAEARIMASLRHPNIVPVSRFGTDGATGLDYYVMDEFLPSREERRHVCRDILRCAAPDLGDGRAPLTLSHVLDGGKALPEDAVVSLALQLLSAMEAAHDLSPPVVHRDIKPSNILFAADGRALLSDFGIAKRLSPDEADDAGWTEPNAAPGTWAYSAPEQRRGGAVEKATDYYALGLVLFRALTGGMPSRSAALPTDVSPRVSKAWRRLFAGLLEPCPDHRLADPACLRSALEEIREDIARREERGRILRTAARLAAMAAVIAAFAAAWAAFAPGRGNAPGAEKETPQAEDETPKSDGASPPLGEATLEASSGETGPDAENAGEAPRAPGEPKFDNKAWVAQYIREIRSLLKRASVPPQLDAAGRIRIATGMEVLFGDIPAPESVSEIVLDGGTIRLAPSSESLLGQIAKCKNFIDNAPEDATITSDLFLELNTDFAYPLVVTTNGGALVEADGDIKVRVKGPVKCAPGAQGAELAIGGFSSIILNRATLDPALRIKGQGQIADFGTGGVIRNRRWFDEDDPL